uniref:Uncharacterized protein n=1 Tax=Meloidogyne enterolobii TaxID=390850 RepID=A0A6V7VWY7_MELEN|nr:unnamed protein product [Meloidogyne enterolobii]
MAGLEELLNETKTTLEKGQDTTQIRRRLVQFENAQSRKNANVQLNIAKCYLEEAKSKVGSERKNKLIEAEVWIKKSLATFVLFDALVTKGKILGLKISESKNAWDDAQWALEAYNTLLDAEKINKKDDDVLLMRGIMMFYASGMNWVERNGAKAFCPASRTIINESSFEKTISILKKCKTNRIEKYYYLANCYDKIKNKKKAVRCYNILLETKAKNLFESEFKTLGRDELEELKKR